MQAWLHEGPLLGYKDFSLCPHLIEGAKGLLRASFIKVLIPWRGLTCGSDRKASAYNAGDLGSIPESGRSSGEGNSNPHQYSCLENPIDRGSCCATVHGVAKSRAQLSNFTSLHFNPMENSMDRGAWWAPLGLQGVHGVTKSQTQLSN